MAFRGYGDQALQVIQSKREDATRRAQIAASERASERGAAVSLANLSENARQANMGDVREQDRLAAAENARVDDMNFRREGLAANITAQADSAAIQKGNLDLNREQLAQQAQDNKVDQTIKLAGVAQNERQLAINESTFTKTQMDAQRLQDAQDEMMQAGTAAQLAALRAAVVAKGPLPMPYINGINDAMGVAYGEPGSVTMITPIPDPETGARIGVGVRKIRKDGTPEDSVMDPVTLFPKLRASMSPESWLKLFGEVRAGQTSRGNDRTTVGAQLEHAKFEKEREAALAAEQTRLETARATDKTMLRDDVVKTGEKIAKIAKIREGMLGLEDAPVKVPTSDFGKLDESAKPAAPSAPADSQPKAGSVTPSAVKLSNGKIRVTTPYGEVRDLPDDEQTATLLASVNLSI